MYDKRRIFYGQKMAVASAGYGDATATFSFPVSSVQKEMPPEKTNDFSSTESRFW